MAMPIGIPMRRAKKRPMAKWVRLTSKSARRIPFCRREMKARRTSAGPGNRKLFLMMKAA
jgi:hypothetical protein